MFNNPLKMYDMGSEKRSKNIRMNKMGNDLKNRINSYSDLKDHSDLFLELERYPEEIPLKLRQDEQPKNDDDIDNTGKKINDQLIDIDSEIEIIQNDLDLFPHEGGKFQGQKNVLRELLEYQRGEINNVLQYLINNHGGCFYYNVDPLYLFKVSMQFLEIVVNEYNMDGVIVSVDKPANYIKRILDKSFNNKYEPFYIDCCTCCYPSQNFKNKPKVEQDKFNDFIFKNNITYLYNNFNFNMLRDSIEINLQKVAELYDGEQHFIFFDNIAAFQNFCSDSEIKNFFKSFANDLEKLNLFGFFMIPKGSINITLRHFLQNLPGTISNKLGIWNNNI
jgi:hypothetical protein